MERPGDHLGAREGLELGYGLHNYSSNFESWHFREHNGAVNNGLSAFAYLPQANAGYAVLLNSGEAVAHQEIANLLRKYIVRNLEHPLIEKERELSDEQRAWAGYYVALVDDSRIIFIRVFVSLGNFKIQSTSFCQYPLVFTFAALFSKC